MTTNPEYRKAARYLSERDPVLRRIIEQVGPCQLRRSTNFFLTLLESIVWQQLSWKAALTIHERLLRTIGTPRPKPADVLRTPVDDMRAAGLSRAKSDYLHDLSARFEDGRFPRRRIRLLSDEEVVAQLCEIKGIGLWTAEMFLMFGLNRLDVFPAGDVGLRNALAKRYRLRNASNMKRLEAISRRWRPYRTIASWYVWASSDGMPFEDDS